MEKWKANRASHFPTPLTATRLLEQKQNFRNVLEMVRGGFFLKKKPLDRSDSPYTYSAFAINRSLLQALHVCDCFVSTRA